MEGSMGLSDLLSKSPTIVCVFPEPVCPYAKIVPLYPFNADLKKNYIILFNINLHQ